MVLIVMKVKVIKKHEKEATVVETIPAAKTASESARDMVGTVSSWVADLRARKGAETKAAVETLLRGPSPSES